MFRNGLAQSVGDATADGAHPEIASSSTRSWPSVSDIADDFREASSLARPEDRWRPQSQSRLLMTDLAQDFNDATAVDERMSNTRRNTGLESALGDVSPVAEEEAGVD